MEKYLLTILLTLSIAFHSYAQSGELQKLYTDAIDAQRKGDNTLFYELIMKAHEIHPYHQGILYQVGIAAALNNKNTEAVNYLRQAILNRSDFVLGIPELNSLKGNKDFEALLKLQTELSKAIVKSDTAFIIKNKTLHVESVAPGEAAGVFYVSSIHKRKIVRINPDKSISDFTTQAQDGLSSVFDLKLSENKKSIWVCS